MGAASVPGLHCPPEKPTATTPRWSGWERNLEGMAVVEAVGADMAVTRMGVWGLKWDNASLYKIPVEVVLLVRSKTEHRGQRRKNGIENE